MSRESNLELIRKEFSISMEFVKLFYDQNNGDVEKTKKELKVWLSHNTSY
jgi:hypothetical protein